MPIASLTTGCLASIMAGVDIEKPVLQILGSKGIASAEGTQRYRMLVSDGEYLHSFAMLATQLNDMVTSGNLVENTIVRVDRYITSLVNKAENAEKRVLIILNLEVLNLGTEVGSKIGNPTQIKNAVVIDAAENNQNSTNKNSFGGESSSVNNASANNNSYSSNVNMSQSISDQLTHPIASLSPYQNKWVIKARVSSKSAIREWKNAKGEGKLFSMDLMDESGEIRATAFKEMCDKYYEMIQMDKVYFISKCQLKPANKQFSSIKNDYEMTFSNDTIVQECMEDVDSIPTMQYNFIPIADIAKLEPNSIVDVIGVCKDIGNLFEFKAKATGRDLKKKDITLVDDSNASINLTLWGAEAENFQGFQQSILLLKGLRVNEFGGGKSVSMGSGSVIKTNPDILEAHKLRGWFDNGGADNISGSLSNRQAGGSNFSTEWMTFHEVKAKNLGNSEKPDYFQCKAVVHIVKSTNVLYKACAQKDCNKKVIDQENGQYRCEKCTTDYPNFKYRLLLNMSIGDWTSNRWITCFSDLAEEMLEKSADELGRMQDSDKDQFDMYFTNLNFKSFIFKLRAKADVFGDASRLKFTAISAVPINHKEYNGYLIKNIQNIMGIGNN